MRFQSIIFATVFAALPGPGCNEKPSPDSSVQQSGNSFTTNTISWETGSEDGLFGFELFRAETEDGPFQRMNPLPLRAAGTTDIPQKYELKDEKAVVGQKYFYFIQSLDYNNVRKRYSPVFPYQTPDR